MPSKNIPVNGWPQIKELDIAAPVLAELDKIEAWQKSVKQETKTGAEITFTNALALAAVSLSAEIEHIQDLHGYNKPWVGGAGKNKLPMTVSGIKAANTNGTWSGNRYTMNDVTIDIVTDDADNIIAYKVNGTNSGSEFVFSTPFGGIATGNYYANGCADGGSDSNFDVYFWNVTTGARVKRWDGSTGSVSLYNSTTSAEIQVPNTTDNLIYNIRIRAGYTANNVMFYPMIRLSTESDATFAPYSNICPISGHTSVGIERSGKNLVKGVLHNTSINGNGVVFSGGTADNYAIAYCKVKAGETYTIKTSEDIFVYGLYNDVPVVGASSLVGRVVLSTKTFTPTIDAYLAYRMGNTYATPQVEVGTESTTYEAPQVVDVIIQLGQTVYGGEVDFNEGIAKVTDGYIASYDGETLPSTWISDRDVYAEGTTPTTGAEVVYKLATPTTIQLTPTQLQMLKGYNRLSADTGNIEVTAYTGNKWN